MFDWIQELLVGIGDTIGSALAEAWETVSGEIWPEFLTWIRLWS